jgi:hypothetical protein
MHSLFVALLLSADLSPQMRSAMDHISAQSLRGHLSFIASDLLEGRATLPEASTWPPNTSLPNFDALDSSPLETTDIFRPRPCSSASPTGTASK